MHFRALSTLLPATLILFAACTDEAVVDPGDDGIPVPAAYAFDSRFDEGAGSVNYGGQIVRNLLINDLKIRVDGLGKAEATAITEQDLLRRYDYEDAYDLTTLTAAGTTPLVDDGYSDIATDKDLIGKLDDAPLIGWGQSADDVIRGYFQQIAANSEDAAKRGTPAVYTTEEGVDMSQMINKILLGAVVYSQGTGTYLNTILDRDNGAPSGDNPFTSMEHAWDEAFGYFGAARDYAQYSDQDLAADLLWRDSNGDGAIDLQSEYNYAFARNAAKRDQGGSGVDFTGEIFQAFLEGRTAITNQESAQEIAAQRDLIVAAWEKVIGATVVHYINDTIDDMESTTADQLEAKNNTALNTHWAEMKGYAFALQYNPFKAITDAQLSSLHELVGDAPAYAAPGSDAAASAVSDLLEARDILQSAYGFSDANASAW